MAAALWPIVMAIIFVVALYGGYFGAGIGILMIGALSLLTPGDIRHVVALKNLLTGCLRAVAVMVLVIEGIVDWRYGALMALGGLLGGYFGGSRRIARTGLLLYARSSLGSVFRWRPTTFGGYTVRP